jgi:hypothetical protein
MNSPEQTATKDYLGDGVYVMVLDQMGTIELTTENGIEATNTIVIEPNVLRTLMKYLKRQGFKL